MIFLHLLFFWMARPLKSSPLKFVQLRSESTGKYVTVYWPEGDVRVDSVSYTHASTFELHRVSGIENQVQLRALKNNLYLSAEGGGGYLCVANRTSASGWETFKTTYLTSNRIVLESFNGQFVAVDYSHNFQLVASATSSQLAEIFIIDEIPQHRGVNLGSWFVPEKWMFSYKSDLWVDSDAVDLYSLSISLGPEEASKRLNKHWSTWFTESDFKIMASRGINHVRIPIGYWDIVETYPFVYGAMTFIDKAIVWAAQYGMTVLIDLHGAPGSQNGNDHSGKSGPIEWPQPQNVAKTVEILGLIAAKWANVQNVWGIEMLNEPDWSISHDLLTQFYRDGYAAIRQHSDSVNVVMCSLYGPHDWTAQVLSEPEYRNVALDLHLYTVWSGLPDIDAVVAETARWGDEIRALTPFYPIIVGEMSLGSCLQDYTTAQRQREADSEMNSFQQNAFGYIFWSNKLEDVSEDWCFADAFPYIKDYYLV